MWKWIPLHCSLMSKEALTEVLSKWIDVCKPRWTSSSVGMFMCNLLVTGVRHPHPDDVSQNTSYLNSYIATETLNPWSPHREDGCRCWQTIGTGFKSTRCFWSLWQSFVNIYIYPPWACYYWSKVRKFINWFNITTFKSNWIPVTVFS